MTTTDGSYVVSRIPRAVVLQPDVGFVRMERVADPETTRSAIEGAPDLAVEVRSPSDVVLEIEGKIGRYLRAGTRLAWLVDPLRQRVTVWRAGEAEPAVLTTDDVLEGHDVLPGFRLPVREVFNNPRRDPRRARAVATPARPRAGRGVAGQGADTLGCTVPLSRPSAASPLDQPAPAVRIAV